MRARTPTRSGGCTQWKRRQSKSLSCLMRLVGGVVFDSLLYASIAFTAHGDGHIDEWVSG